MQGKKPTGTLKGASRVSGLFLQMPILLCAATAAEIQPTITDLTHTNPDGVELLITGVGLMAATYAISRKVQSMKPSLIVQAGIAGSLDDTIALGSVCLVASEMVGDLGVTEAGQFRSVFDLQLENGNMHPWKDGKLYNNAEWLGGFGLPVVPGITVNEVSTAAEKIAYYRNGGAVTESMEGAALHYVALLENIPFIQLRALSNFAGERDKTNWEIQAAITALNTALVELLQKIRK